MAGPGAIYRRAFAAVIRSTLLACLVVFAGALEAAEVSKRPSADKSAAPVKQVLVLNSYHKGFAWSDSIMRGIEETLDKSPEVLDLWLEYMDTKRIKGAEYLETLHQLYRRKYAGKKFDVIITSDNNALNFLLERRAELFPGTPVVFSGYNGFKPALLKGHGPITGVVETTDFKSTLDLALKFQPRVEEVVVITPDTASGRVHKRLMANLAPRYGSAVTFSYWHGLTISEIERRVSALSARTIFASIGITRTEDGRLVSNSETVRRIARVAKAPVYSGSDVNLGHGTLGGHLVSGAWQGRTAARLALDILNGKKAADIPIVSQGANRYMFDDTQLRRFRIDEAELPAGSIVINKSDTFYHENRTLIWAAVGVVLSLAAFIFLLLFHISRRRSVEEELRASEARFRNLIEGSIQGILIHRNHEPLFVNEAWATIHGYRAEEVLQMDSVLPLAAPHDRDRLVGYKEARLRGEDAPSRYEYEGLRRDGSTILLGNAVRVVTWHGEPAIQSTVIDITEHKEAKEQARRADARLLDALESAAEGFILYDAEERLVFCDSKYREFYWQFADLLVPGARLEDLVRASLERGMFDDEGDPEGWIRKRLEQYRSPPNSHVQQLTDGRWIHAAECRTQEDGIFGIRTDITEWRRTEEALKESEERFRTVVDNSPTAIVLKDLDGRYRIVNKTYEEWFGLSSKDVLGKTSHDVYPKELADALVAHDQEVISEATAIHREHEVTFADGTSHTVASTKFPVLDKAGRVIGAGTIGADITEQRKAEDGLRQAQKLEAVGQLTGGIAHEFNNLLLIIQGNAELVEAYVKDDATLRSYISPLSDAVRRGADLTHRLLTFGRRQLLEPKVLDLGDVVRENARMLRQPLGETVTLTTVIGDDLWPVMADRSELGNAITNLALNARDAMPAGGKLIIATENADLDEGFAATRPGLNAGHYVVVAVTDTGHGMPAEVCERVFEPFFTTKGLADHSGLGLSMVYGFVNQSDGFIEVESEPDVGTTVKLFLPRTSAREIVSDGAPARPRALPSAREETVLVVEDDPEVLGVTVTMVRELGYKALEAKDGRSALALLDQGHAVDVLLTDVVMPGGMSGPDLFQHARRRHSDLRALLVSGYGDSAIGRYGAFSVGANLLRKPFTISKLALELENILEQGRDQTRAGS